MRAKSLALATTSLGVLLSMGSGFAQTGNDSVEVVVVTGSRIPRPELSSPNPIQVVGEQEIRFNGVVNLTDYLQRIPALTGSMGDVQQSGLSSTITDAGASLSGLNVLDLRNLGFNRTLVLEDGQRLVSSSAGDAAIDINTIPVTLISRVDVVTGGSSAVYGADGVTGVVNFIMKHDLEGVDARFQASPTQDGGDNRYLAAVSVGHNFDNNNGNVELTVENTYQDRLNYTQRRFTNVGGGKFFVPNPANPNGSNPALPANISVSNGTIYQVAATGAIGTDFNTFTPTFNGNGTPYNTGNIINGEFALGGDGLPLSSAFLADFAPVEHRTLVQLAADDRFSNWFKLSGQFSFAHVDTKSQSEPSFNQFASVTSDNPFLPANVRSAILADGTAPFNGQSYGVGTFGSYPYLTPALVFAEKVSRDIYRGVLGADGEFPVPDFIHDASYDVHYVYGQSDINDVNEHNLIEDRYYAALDSVQGPNGPTCRSNLNPAATPPTTVFGDGLFDEVVGLPSSLFGTTFTPGPNSGCAAFNPFVANSPSNAAAIAFMTRNTPTTAVIRQQDLNGYVSFDFPQFSDWGVTAKPVSVVLGGEWREEFSKSVSDPATRQVPIPGEPGRTASLYFISGPAPVKGRFEVKEAFGEMSVPVLADRPFADELTFDFAGRVSDYSTAGTDETWKIDGVYAPLKSVKFRATDAVAVRAPNIGELFAPLVQGFQGINDPCDPQFIGQGTPFRKNNCQALEDALLGPGVYTAGVTPVQQSVTLPVFIGGNSKLQPETARTLTFGAVLQPDFIPNLVVTADWYRVKITSAIRALSGQTIVDQCVDLSSINNPFCAAVTRNGNSVSIPGSVQQVVAQEINVAASFTQGVDFSATYTTNLDDLFDTHAGSLTLHFLGNHMDVLSFTSIQGQAPVNGSNYIAGGSNGGPAPFWQAYLDAVWSLDDWTVDYNIQWADGLLNFTRRAVASEPNIISQKLLHTPDEDVHSIQVRYQVQDGWQVYAGVQNLWYQKPSANDQTNGFPDPFGRVFYVGVDINTDPFD